MLGVREELLRGLIFLDPALIDEDNAVGHLAGEAHLVGDHQHGDAGVGQPLHQLQHLADHLRVKGGGGLVEQDDIRVHGQSAGNGNALLLAAKGIKCYKITEKTGDVVGVKAVNDDNEIMMITTEGIIIRTAVDSISILGRNTSGVKVMNVGENVEVASIAKVREEKLEDEMEKNTTEE